MVKYKIIFQLKCYKKKCKSNILNNLRFGGNFNINLKLDVILIK